MKLKGIQNVTKRQIEFGKLLGLDLHGQSVGVAMARIEDEIKYHFWGISALGSPSEKQIELARKFGFDITKETKAVGFAVINDIMHHLNVQAIESEGLQPNVRVRKKWEPYVEFVISSIREDGTVFFKGGNGQRAWARTLKRINTKPNTL
jgi:hypothetical protein